MNFNSLKKRKLIQDKLESTIIFLVLTFLFILRKRQEKLRIKKRRGEKVQWAGPFTLHSRTD